MTERYAAARKHLRDADPVLARLIDKHPNFDPRAWMAVLPKMDAYGALVFQIIGQQLSVRSTRAILARLEALFAGRLPEPQEILDADPVHGFLIIAVDRPDVVLAGDVALRRAIRNVYGLDQVPTEAEVLLNRRALAALSQPCGQLPLRIGARDLACARNQCGTQFVGRVVEPLRLR